MEVTRVRLGPSRVVEQERNVVRTVDEIDQRESIQSERDRTCCSALRQRVFTRLQGNNGQYS